MTKTSRIAIICTYVSLKSVNFEAFDMRRGKSRRRALKILRISKLKKFYTNGWYRRDFHNNVKKVINTTKER